MVRMFAFAFMCASTLALGCSTPQSPSSADTKVPAVVQGIPNATALANLPEVLRLEHTRAAGTSLVILQGTSQSTSGRISEVSFWRYVFADPVTGKRVTWSANIAGQIEFRGDTFSEASDPVRDLAPHLVVDTDRVVQAALPLGGNRYLELYPDSQILVGVGFVGPVPSWTVMFERLVSGHCTLRVSFHATTGELLGRSTGCID
jgi:hypothetical protein